MVWKELGMDVVLRCSGMGLLWNCVFINGWLMGVNFVIGFEGNDGLDCFEFGVGGVLWIGVYFFLDLLLLFLCDVSYYMCYFRVVGMCKLL